jgi:hypothetical protein
LKPFKQVVDLNDRHCDGATIYLQIFNAKTPRRKDAKNYRIGLPSQSVTERRFGFAEVNHRLSLGASASLRLRVKTRSPGRGQNKEARASARFVIRQRGMCKSRCLLSFWAMKRRERRAPGAADKPKGVDWLWHGHIMPAKSG